jgi:hypothetical protein
MSTRSLHKVVGGFRLHNLSHLLQSVGREQQATRYVSSKLEISVWPTLALKEARETNRRLKGTREHDKLCIKGSTRRNQ